MKKIVCFFASALILFSLAGCVFKKAPLKPGLAPLSAPGSSIAKKTTADPPAPPAQCPKQIH